MIVLIEGPRGSGKSHLVDNFFTQNKDDRFIYYKWEFSKWVSDLGINENCESTHYLSIGNILTILELSQTLFEDKILVLDRSIFSAYVWAMYLKRLDQTRSDAELNTILLSSIYQNCKLVYVTRDESVKEFNRDKKDIFDAYENYGIEKRIFDETFTIFNKTINESDIGNSMIMFNNRFDSLCQFEFNKLLNSFTDK
jgi:thymidylate kinase